MNKHIELVKQWRADKDSVTLERLHANYDSAADAEDAAHAALRDAEDACDAAAAADVAAEAAYADAWNAAVDATVAEATAKEAFFQKKIDVSPNTL